MKKDIQGVIFDIDGVLLDSMEIWTDLGASYLQSMHIRPKPGLSEVLFSMSMEQGASYLKKQYSLHQSEEQILEGLRDLLQDFYFYEVSAKPGAKALMERFKARGIKMTAATSSPRSHVEKALARNGLLPYLDRIFTNAEIGSGKESPQIYNAASDFMKTNPAHTMVIEDSLYALQTAARAGYYTVGIYDAKGEPDQIGLKEAADLYIDRLDQLDIEKHGECKKGEIQ